MRIAHFTDIHVELPLRPHELASKRLVAWANLTLFGRSDHFTHQTVEALVARIVAEAPDLVVCTGDLTSTGTEREFMRARALLAPIIDRFPFVCIPGNHDLYTPDGAAPFKRHFGAFSGDAVYPFTHTFGEVDVVGIQGARPALTSQGVVSGEQLRDLDRLLAKGHRPALVLSHYPLRNRHGRPYGPPVRNLRNAAAVESVLGRHARVAAVLHGHEHHGYRTEIPAQGRSIASFDPGASGYALLPTRNRTAHFNLYDLGHSGRIDVTRYAYDGRVFALEAGGAYATGR
jgi:3',5'-cyclic AMP phosphodiesterase CpdA